MMYTRTRTAVCTSPRHGVSFGFNPTIPMEVQRQHPRHAGTEMDMRCPACGWQATAVRHNADGYLEIIRGRQFCKVI